jgi:hypothetical protein
MPCILWRHCRSQVISSHSRHIGIADDRKLHEYGMGFKDKMLTSWDENTSSGLKLYYGRKLWERQTLACTHTTALTEWYLYTKFLVGEPLSVRYWRQGFDFRRHSVQTNTGAYAASDLVGARSYLFQCGAVCTQIWIAKSTWKLTSKFVIRKETVYM